MHVSEIWRYPAKSLKGEPLQETEITHLGIPGDREIVVMRSLNGRYLTARVRPALLGLQGSLNGSGPAINGVPWDSSEAQKIVNDAAGEPTTLIRVPGPERFDVLPLLIATDGTVEVLGIDRRRLRPNLVIAGVNRLSERDWPGKIIAIGRVRIKAVKLRERCVMTTYDPDTQEQDKSVLLRIIRDLDGVAALDCSIIEPGNIRIGDQVQILL
ncbi:MAG TPA: MOSC N-terminal beta barrel domain-containing protein [Terriglobales bacterium]|nr:MOSC N-terminal beta barrel domain-containing protein [Terriglobales bacterium]